jgi:DNA-binding CsgD family transcriptional regulator
MQRSARQQGGPSAKQQVETERQTEIALEMRAEGKTLREIGQRLGVTPQTVHNRLAKAYSDIKDPLVADLRKELDSQFDYLLSRVADRVRAGELRAIETALRILEKKAILHGANLPQQHTLELVPPERSQFLDPQSEIAQLKAQLAVAQAQQTIDAEVIASVHRPALRAAPEPENAYQRVSESGD